MTKNVLRVSYNGNDLRYVVGSKTLTSYAKGREPYKVDITDPANREVLHGLVDVALVKNKFPSRGIVRNTNKNTFTWGTFGLHRFDLVRQRMSKLRPEKDFSIRVAANLLLKAIES